MSGNADAVHGFTCACTCADVDEWLVKNSDLLGKKLVVKEKQGCWLLYLQSQRRS